MIDLKEHGVEPNSAIFYNYEGIPVTIGHQKYPGTVAWDKIPPRPFPPKSLYRNGYMIDFEAFKSLLTTSLSKEDQTGT